MMIVRDPFFKKSLLSLSQTFQMVRVVSKKRFKISKFLDDDVMIGDVSVCRKREKTTGFDIFTRVREG